MKTVQEQRPDPEVALRDLKRFQRRTVEYAYRRLFTDPDSTRRFLVADEVGLGKTMVARGVIAKAVDHLWDRVDRIDIVYVCSNSEIARQNINRLRPKGSQDFAMATRATLLPIQLQQLSERRVNYVSMTPGTSLAADGGTGVAEERALLFHLLRDRWQLPYTEATNVLRVGKGAKRFRDMIDYFLVKPGSGYTIDPQLRDAFLKELDTRELAAGGRGLRARFLALCKHFQRSDAQVTGDVGNERWACIAELRRVLGRVCIRALRPDLVILDEFQRFKHLLTDATDEAELARELFEYADQERGEEVRVLLLSATPYKMYTMQHEVDSGSNDHYQDFLATYAFLVRHNPEAVAALKKLLDEYRSRLLGLSKATLPQLCGLRDQIRARLAAVIARTEKLAVTDDRSGMLESKAMGGIELRESDVRQYVVAARLSRSLDQGDLLEYWKSSPFLLNFMDEYELKKSFKTAAAKLATKELLDSVANGTGMMLNWDDVRSYRRIDPANARLRGLTHDTVDKGLWKLLWLPPSLPYYQAGGAFSEVAVAATTKRLVFSSWKVVPKVIAAMLSYEAERRAMELYDRNVRAPSADGERKRITQLLQFSRSDGRYTGMPVLALMYPSTMIAGAFDPAATNRCQDDVLPTILEMRARARAALEPSLARVIAKHAREGTVDEAWYWAAPLLLDLDSNPQATKRFFERPKLAVEWKGGQAVEDGDPEDGSDQQGWLDHVERARQLVQGGIALGQPPEDLRDVLTCLALAGPGVAALRSFVRGRPEPELLTDPSIRLAAASVGWRFRNLFNLPDAIALVRGMNAAEPYWLRALEYAVDGSLQSTLDEYVHTLRESLGVSSLAAVKATADIASAMTLALSLRASTVRADNIRLSSAANRVELQSAGISSRFAARFGQDSKDELGESTRSDKVRAAFNSPFWPFVLASTSVGQEGLDFHHYCHAIVHWNLPSNPVDLEQREGRVHRFMGHAIRKNMAMQHGPQRATPELHDPWDMVVAMAEREQAGGGNELKPFWVYRPPGGVSIERYVPSLRLSQDANRLEYLRKSLAVYRMVLGQPRQDELLEYLLTHMSRELVDEAMSELRISLEPPSVEPSNAASP